MKLKIWLVLNILIPVFLRNNKTLVKEIKHTVNNDSGPGSHSELSRVLCGHPPHPTWPWVPCTGQPGLGWQNTCEGRRVTHLGSRHLSWERGMFTKGAGLVDGSELKWGDGGALCCSLSEQAE